VEGKVLDMVVTGQAVYIVGGCTARSVIADPYFVFLAGVNRRPGAPRHISGHPSSGEEYLVYFPSDFAVGQGSGALPSSDYRGLRVSFG
jgi:hypothetical protein